MVTATIRAQKLREEAEAANARTAESERELRQIGEFRDRFIGIVGHDLRTPLTSIGLTALSLLRNGPLDQQATKRVDRTVSSTERMTKMISQLLDLHAVAWEAVFRSSRCPPISATCSKASSRSSRPPIQLEVEGDVTGTWDADRLAEALSNIAGNAVEHALPGTPVVVTARGEGPDVVVEVSIMGNPSRRRASVHLRTLPPSEAAREDARGEPRPRPLHRKANRALGQRHARRLLHRRQDDVFHAPAPPCAVPDAALIEGREAELNPLRWILRPVAGQANTERGSRLARRANRDSATVRNCDLLNEIESEAIPPGARMHIVLSGTREGLEFFPRRPETYAHRGGPRSRRPKVSARHDSDRLMAAVLNCVSHEVRGQLCEPVTVPITSEVTEGIEAQDAVRVVLRSLRAPADTMRPDLPVPG